MNAGPDPVVVTATATGGKGNSWFNAPPPIGGAATAIATGTGQGPTSVIAVATGGQASSGTNGTANATATANGGWQTTLASAIVNGSSGTATANANSDGLGLFSSITGELIAPISGSTGSGVAGVAEVETMMGVSTTLLSPSTAIQAAGLGIGLPTAANVNTAWAGDTNVQSAFGSAASVQGLANFNLAETSGGRSFSELNFEVNVPHLETEQLTVGWLNPAQLGNGLQNGGSLSLEIDLQGAELFSETFTSNASLLSFFNNNVIYLALKMQALSMDRSISNSNSISTRPRQILVFMRAWSSAIQFPRFPSPPRRCCWPSAPADCWPKWFASTASAA